MELTHLNARGEAHMVDIGEKSAAKRAAVAEAVLTLRPETLQKIVSNDLKKGDVLAVARVAGIMAAKKTAELIPLCHSIPLDGVEVAFFPLGPDKLRIEAAVTCSYKTGVEMEALAAASIAALTVYDMCKAVDKGMEIGQIRLLEKTGGRSGTYKREDA
ncbi:MAG TPA: cyclic pyranopterin monophosphate synthase MoaC [Feifaniaceae bacterium]|nr:cyclic pyranopterin monophosphate synthase MoaC [Feifaniaceae bacterium]